MYRVLLSLFFFSISLSFQAEAQPKDPCIECGERKLSLCSQECALVPGDATLTCQFNCLTEYCSHRCVDKEGKPTHHMLESLFTKGCESCKDEQYNLCLKTCSGSPYRQAVCGVTCANKRCTTPCKPEAEKQK